MEKFWEIADESKLNAQYSSDKKLEFLKLATGDEIRRICTQYRFFVYDYPNNLSILIGKLQYGPLKSLLAEINSEELGSGKSEDAHIVWYDRFLTSIGVTNEELQTSLYPENKKLLSSIAASCRTKPVEYVIGTVGMGGECLCQIYLTNMHKYLVQNEYIKSINDQIDWHFWDFHIGEEDIAHRMMVRKAINKMQLEPNCIEQLAAGYEWGKQIWDEFWANNYKETGLSH